MGAPHVRLALWLQLRAPSRAPAGAAHTLRYPAHVNRRYRCGACGNLTRFDVTTTRRTSAFHHYNLAGELTVEDEQVLEEAVEEVSCRWCGHGRSVEPVEEPEQADA